MLLEKLYFCCIFYVHMGGKDRAQKPRSVCGSCHDAGESDSTYFGCSSQAVGLNVCTITVFNFSSVPL